MVPGLGFVFRVVGVGIHPEAMFVTEIGYDVHELVLVLECAQVTGYEFEPETMLAPVLELVPEPVLFPLHKHGLWQELDFLFLQVLQYMFVIALSSSEDRSFWFSMQPKPLAVAIAVKASLAIHDVQIRNMEMGMATQINNEEMEVASALSGTYQSLIMFLELFIRI